ncbi:MAG: hypothetical protein OK456_02175 [Thaumarchaeota archaeon]|nr:hypothetical protein [Nitrososphaerota archaeon]
MVKKELATFDDFRLARLGDTGVIVITGSAGHGVAHRLNGRCISAEKFKGKVLLDANTTGRYYWVDSVASAITEMGASGCKLCKPHIPDKDDKFLRR